MKPELQDRLFDNFDFYIKGDSWETRRPWYGFECGDGWFSLLFELSTKLKEVGFNGIVNQVKEKFGTLRFCVDNVTEEQDKIIEKYEDKSHIICESCGKIGYIRKGGWLQILCNECYKENKNE